MTDRERKERRAVIEEARSWLNTPYHATGRVKGAGVDCSMLPAEVYFACGVIPRIEIEPYPQQWNLHRGRERLLEAIEPYAREVADPLPADLALYRNGRCVSHAAIIVDWPTVIHAVAGIGVVSADSLLPSRLTRHFHAFYRPRRWD